MYNTYSADFWEITLQKSGRTVWQIEESCRRIFYMQWLTCVYTHIWVCALFDICIYTYLHMCNVWRVGESSWQKVNSHYCEDTLSCRSLSAKEPLIVGLFCVICKNQASYVSSPPCTVNPYLSRQRTRWECMCTTGWFGNNRMKWMIWK